MTTEQVKTEVEIIFEKLQDLNIQVTPKNSNNQDMKIQQALWLIEKVLQEFD